ncbi:thiol-disulfide isomerase/thioredoxin [Mangrovibacterium marinum]|uniref:Thiol-disulfide isomerase/thioredoxin n=2 Tax=Mangrovibacterium marinum TaxID=1639118 RepID=A0A2T5C3N3_9BACT|nr:thiol-disulfide isomerase/thioredoxin [Mangrovibacterium marinum]
MRLMRKKLWSFCSFLLFTFSALHCGAQAVQIQINFPEHRDSQLLVAGYYFGGLYVKDTLQLDAQGMALLSKDSLMDQGIYELYLNEQQHFDFLLGADQQFGIKLVPEKNQIRVEGANETKQFQAYINYLAGQKARYAELSAKLKDAPDSPAQIKHELQQLDQEVRQYQYTIGLKNKDNLFGKMVLATQRPTINPEQIPEKYRANDSLKWVYEYNFRKQHYWDNFDLGERALWRTPFVKSQLQDYFNKVLLQSPDSVLPEAIRIIEKFRDNAEIFQNLTSFLVNNTIQSKIMGMENVFVALAKRYYLSGQGHWADDKTMENIRQEVALRQNNLLGQPAPELLLEDAEGKFHSLYDQTARYTILAFWEPGCSHCKKEIPKLYDELFLQARPSELTVYAVYTMTDKQEWSDFLEQHELNGWHNLWDPKQISNMKRLYGIRTTPSFFLLDQDKKIIAKQLDVAGLRHFLMMKGVIPEKRNI